MSSTLSSSNDEPVPFASVVTSHSGYVPARKTRLVNEPCSVPVQFTSIFVNTGRRIVTRTYVLAIAISGYRHRNTVIVYGTFFHCFATRVICWNSDYKYRISKLVNRLVPSNNGSSEGTDSGVGMAMETIAPSREKYWNQKDFTSGNFLQGLKWACQSRLKSSKEPLKKHVKESRKA